MMLPECLANEGRPCNVDGLEHSLGALPSAEYRSLLFAFDMPPGVHAVDAAPSHSLPRVCC